MKKASLPLLRWLIDGYRLFYPRVCAVCGRGLVEGEHAICVECLQHQPHTHYAHEADNKMERLFWGRVQQVEHAAALYFFEKGSEVQQLLHRLKYKNDPEIGRVLGRYAAHEMQGAPISQIEAIIPVPLHPKRLRQRGYNQSTQIAQGLASVWGTPVDETVLTRSHANATQTHKNVFDRWENTEQLFTVSDTQRYQGKHVLLVDDVVTTGATLCACAEQLAQTPDIHIHCFSIAIAR